MKTLLAKTKVAEVTDFGNNNKRTRLTRPDGTSEENKSFSQFTPQISVEILVNNPEAIDYFQPGEEVYLKFSKEPFIQIEDKVDENFLNLLERCYNHLLFPGRYNNSQLHNLRVAVSMVLDERADKNHITFEGAGGIQTTLAEMQDGLSLEDYQDFACTEIGQTISNGLYKYKRIR